MIKGYEGFIKQIVNREVESLAQAVVSLAKRYSSSKPVFEATVSVEDIISKMSEQQAAKNKELEEKFPELKKIFDEALKFENEVIKPYNDDLGKKFDELINNAEAEEEGVSGVLKALGKFVKEVGVMKSMKMIKDVVKMASKGISFENKVSKIIPDGEKYELPAIGVVTGGQVSEAQEIIDTIKSALTIKNLMKLISGKGDEIEIDYKTQDGGTATGQIKDIVVKDDGGIEVSIDNEKVGVVKKDITEIPEQEANDESKEEQDAQKKIGMVQNDPVKMKSVARYAEFLRRGKEPEIKTINDLVDDELAKLGKQ